MNIVKMHGLGNDFIILDARGQEGLNYARLASLLCMRRISVGADGLLVIENSAVADIKMRIINSDGSEAGMCGNGVRCFARYVVDCGIIKKSRFLVETFSGIVSPEVIMDNSEVTGIRVDMGVPCFERALIPMLGEGSSLIQELELSDCTLSCASVLIGVPHTVVPRDTLDGLNISKLGPEIEKHELFPNGTNVNFVEIISRNTVKLRTWERGAGLTLACGTGACATAAVLYELGLTDSQIQVQVAAGSMSIDYIAGRIFMTGPAAYVFEGNVVLPEAK